MTVLVFLSLSLSLGLSLHLMVSHLRSDHSPSHHSQHSHPSPQDTPLQKLVLRILLLVPLNSMNAFLSLVLSPSSSVYFTLLLRDGYEGLVMVSFLHLLLGYCSANPPQPLHFPQDLKVRLPPPACCWTLSPQAHPNYLAWVKVGVYQYLLSRICTTFVSLVSHSLGWYCPESMSYKAAHFYMTLWNGASMVRRFQ